MLNYRVFKNVKTNNLSGFCLFVSFSSEIQGCCPLAEEPTRSCWESSPNTWTLCPESDVTRNPCQFISSARLPMIDKADVNANNHLQCTHQYQCNKPDCVGFLACKVKIAQQEGAKNLLGCQFLTSGMSKPGSFCASFLI